MWTARAPFAASGERPESWGYRKAVAPTMWGITGTLNAPEFALALTGLLNAVAVYETPNAEEQG